MFADRRGADTDTQAENPKGAQEVGTEAPKRIPRKFVAGKEFYYRPNTLDEDVLRENLTRGAYLKHITLEPTDVWLDAGAHIGAFTLSIADRVRTVYAYEPDSVNFALLQKNLALNGNPGDVTVFQELVTGEWRSPRSFFLNNQRNTGSHSMYVKRGREGVWRDACHIKAAMTRALPVNKVKLDIEGAELEVINNFDQWDRVKELIFEYHFAQLKDHNHFMYEKIIQKLCREFPVVRWNPNPKKSWHTIVYAGRYT